jgi:integrase
VDKDPEWRAMAIHTRDELEMMISDERISEWRRVFWSLLFLTGMRFGEAAARRWRHYQSNDRPLGRLVVNTSWNSDLKKEKETKTKQPRDVPVHTLLAEILADWRASGWKRVMGRSPTEDDLIVPFGDPDECVRTNRWERRRYFGEHIDSRMMLSRFHADLAVIGSRPRRQHDARRTFISLCLGDGARRDILSWITHARPKSAAIDDYTSLIWAPLCEEVEKLKVVLRRAPEPIVAVANSPEILGPRGPKVTPRVTPPIDSSEFPGDHAVIESMLLGARRGTRTPTSFETGT